MPLFGPPSTRWSTGRSTSCGRRGRGRLAERLAAESGVEPLLEPEEPRWAGEPGWKELAPGMSIKLLATDQATERLSLLLRLGPGPHAPHEHAGVEEMHVLDGDLWINDRNLRPGDYSRSEPGSRHSRFSSDTGCTCFVVTSLDDLFC